MSAASFAALIPGRLTVTANGRTEFRVMVDGNRADRQIGNSIVFNNMMPGLRSIKVFAVHDFERSRWGGDREEMLYSGGVSIRPAFSTLVELNNRGTARITNIPMLVVRGERGEDRRFGRDEYPDCDHGNVSASLLRDDDFFAAQRVMDRENDRGRMLYGSRLVNDHTVTAIQGKTLADYFRDDADRIDFARMAYRSTLDKNNFAVVSSAFRTEQGRNQWFVFLHNAR